MRAARWAGRRCRKWGFRVSQPRDDPDGDAIQEEIAAAIANVLARREGGFVLNWVAIIESVDDQGERGLWRLTADSAKPWDTVGLLTHALQVMQAQTQAAIDQE